MLMDAYEKEPRTSDAFGAFIPLALGASPLRQAEWHAHCISSEPEAWWKLPLDPALRLCSLCLSPVRPH